MSKLAEELDKLLEKHGVDIDEATRQYKKYIEEKKRMKNRTVKHYNDGDARKGVWCHWIKNEMNPCGCGSNCYHYEYDKAKNIIFGVCNACMTDIYEVKEEFMEQTLAEGKWI